MTAEIKSTDAPSPGSSLVGAPHAGDTSLKKDSFRIVKIALTVLFNVIPLVLAVGGFNFLAIRCILPLFTTNIVRNGICLAVASLCSGVTLLINGVALKAMYQLVHEGCNMFRT